VDDTPPALPEASDASVDVPSSSPERSTAAAAATTTTRVADAREAAAAAAEARLAAAGTPEPNEETHEVARGLGMQLPARRAARKSPSTHPQAPLD
jgi:hypothetical protein